MIEGLLQPADAASSSFSVGIAQQQVALRADAEAMLDGPLASSLTGAVKTQSFLDALRNAEQITDPAQREDAKARAVAQEFVSVAFVQPLLKQLRDTNNAWGPFKPGNTEKQFGAMLDAEYASRITQASSNPLVERLARDLRRAPAGETTTLDRTA